MKNKRFLYTSMSVFALLILGVISLELEARFLSPDQFNRESQPDTERREDPELRQLREQKAVYRSASQDERAYYREIEEPSPNAGNNYLLKSHGLQENPLQEYPDR